MLRPVPSPIPDGPPGPPEKRTDLAHRIADIRRVDVDVRRIYHRLLDRQFRIFKSRRHRRHEYPCNRPRRSLASRGGQWIPLSPSSLLLGLRRQARGEQRQYPIRQPSDGSSHRRDGGKQQQQQDRARMNRHGRKDGPSSHAKKLATRGPRQNHHTNENTRDRLNACGIEVSPMRQSLCENSLSFVWGGLFSRQPASSRLFGAENKSRPEGGCRLIARPTRS